MLPSKARKKIQAEPTPQSPQHRVPNPAIAARRMPTEAKA